MDALDELLKASRPEVDLDGCPPAAAQVARAVARRQRRLSFAWLRRRAVAVAAVAVAVPALATAAVMHFSAETGTFGKPGMTENDTSQTINLCAKDITAFVSTLPPADQALPPGISWAPLDNAWVQDIMGPGRHQDCPPAGPGLQTGESGIRLDLLREAMTVWERWVLTAPTDQQASDLIRADAALAQTQLNMAQIDPTDHDNRAVGRSWSHSEALFAHATLATLRSDYDSYRIFPSTRDLQPVLHASPITAATTTATQASQ